MTSTHREEPPSMRITFEIDKPTEDKLRAEALHEGRDDLP